MSLCSKSWAAVQGTVEDGSEGYCPNPLGVGLHAGLGPWEGT